MTAAPDIRAAWLGESTEARLHDLFAGSALASAKATAAFLGIDVKTLRKTTDALLIRATRSGQTRKYAEADVRDYLARATATTAEPKVSAPPKRAGGRVIPFSRLRTKTHERL